MPLADELHRRTLARSQRKDAGSSAWCPPRAVLHRLLLGVDAAYVRRRDRQHSMDACAGWYNGCRKECLMGKAAEYAAGSILDWIGHHAWVRTGDGQSRSSFTLRCF